MAVGAAIILCLHAPRTGQSAEISESAEKFQKLLDQGLTAFVDEKYEDSVNFFNSALEIRPGDAAAVNALKYAEEKLSKEGSKKNQAFEKELSKARKFISQKEYIVALMALKSILKQSPRYRTALKLRENLLQKAGQVMKKEGSGSFHYWVCLGVVRSIENRADEAFSAWTKALSYRPDDQIVLLAIEDLGMPKGKTGGIASTVDDSQPCDCDISSGTTQMNLFTPLLTSVSISTHSTSIPDPVAASHPASAKAEGENKPVPSEDRIAKKIPDIPVPASKPEPIPAPPVVPEVVPEAEGELEAIEARLRKQDFQGAIGMLEQRLTVNPNDLKSRDMLNRALSSRDESSGVHYRNGLMAYAKGDFSEAIEEWKKTLQIYPDHPNAKKVMVRAFFKYR